MSEEFLLNTINEINKLNITTLRYLVKIYMNSYILRAVTDQHLFYFFLFLITIFPSLFYFILI